MDKKTVTLTFEVDHDNAAILLNVYRLCVHCYDPEVDKELYEHESREVVRYLNDVIAEWYPD